MGRSSSLRPGRALTALLIVLIGLSSHSCTVQRPDPPQVQAGFGQEQATSAQVQASVRLSETLQIAGLQAEFEAIAQQVAPTVVAISAAGSSFNSDDLLRAEEMNTDKLSRVLARTTRTVGTGFIIDSEGYILTNEHVIGEAEQLWVTTDDRKVYPALVVGSDPRSDLAVLKIPASNLPTVKFADESTVKRGQWALALGNPYGLAAPGEMAVSVGVISATNRSLPRLSSKENRIYSNLIQTTAEINPGNSGGPLFNLAGEVIGVNTAVILPQRSSHGIGFAMPINERLLTVVQDLKEGREVVYGYLGVMVSTPTARERRSAGIAEEFGARIDSIEKDTPAAQSGLRVNDIVVSVNGRSISDGDHFVRLIGIAPIDRPAELVIHRGDRRSTIEVSLRKRQLPSVAVTRESQRLRWRGMLLGPIPPNWEESLRQMGGLIVLGIDSGSPMSDRGVTQGAVITAVGGIPVNSVTDLQRIINEHPEETWEIELADVSQAMVAIQP